MLTADQMNVRLHEIYTMAPEYCHNAWQHAQHWYEDASDYAEHLADHYKIEYNQAAGIIAAMSIRQHWKRNKFNAEQFIRWYADDYEDCPQCFGISIAKSKAIMISGNSDEEITSILHGPKISAFFNTIIDHTSQCVVVDSWMVKAFRAGKNGRITEKEYREISRSVMYLADYYRVLPSVMQAYIWILTRGKAD